MDSTISSLAFRWQVQWRICVQHIRNHPFLVILAALGVVIHGGTALLRLSTFWPYPQTVDFGAFYAGAWAMRLQAPLYPFSAELVRFLQEEQGLWTTPPLLNSFPIWAWILQPVTLFSFPVASWLWLGFNLALLAWVAGRLAQLAKVTSRWARLLLFGIALTFGPVVLTLTLGQSSLWLLALSLWIGHRLSRAEPLRSTPTASVDIIGWIGAVSTKLFPVFWAPSFLFFRQWRLMLYPLIAALVFVVVHALALRETTVTYLTGFLPNQTQSFSTGAFVDDQSLLAWLSRLTQPVRLTVTGISATEQRVVLWQPPFALPEPILWFVTGLILVVLGVAVVRRLYRSVQTEYQQAFYLWILFCLLPFPHTERYNHTLLLPAMAFLWGQGPQGQRIAALAYFLAGLSRLTHVWAQILPAPWAALLSGSGLLAVFVLMWSLWQAMSRDALHIAIARTS